jgi:hypothetical protein
MLPTVTRVDVCFWHKADIATRSINVRFWGFGTHILILQEFSTLPFCYPHAYPLPELLAAVC